MKISLLNERITIQKSEITVDEIGNHIDNWTDFFRIYATISKETPMETTSAGNVWDETKIDFTIRYSSELKDLTSKGYRVLFKGNTYEIKGIDHMNYRKKSIKLHCERSEI